MTTEKKIPIGHTPYRSTVYNKKGEAKIVETIEHRDALYSTGEWFNSPDVAKQKLKDEIKVTADKLKLSDSEIEKEIVGDNNNYQHNKKERKDDKCREGK